MTPPFSSILIEIKTHQNASHHTLKSSQQISFLCATDILKHRFRQHACAILPIPLQLVHFGQFQIIRHLLFYVLLFLNYRMYISVLQSSIYVNVLNSANILVGNGAARSAIRTRHLFNISGLLSVVKPTDKPIITPHLFVCLLFGYLNCFCLLYSCFPLQSFQLF